MWCDMLVLLLGGVVVSFACRLLVGGAGAVVTGMQVSDGRMLCRCLLQWGVWLYGMVWYGMVWQGMPLVWYVWLAEPVSA